MIFQSKSKKSLGQNYLTDHNIINKIIKIGEIEKNKLVLEIGPGYGSLTKKILSQNPKELIAIEKDKYLSSHLKETFKSNKNLIIINEDFLKFLTNKKLNKNYVVFGNLPYNISTQILASLVLLDKWPPWYSNLILMFQKEVAERILAKSKGKNFGRLAILCNWRLEIKKHFDVSKNCFSPKPKINSTVLSFKPKKNKFYLKNPKNLEYITRILFSGRRKMINKNFAKLFQNNISVAKDLDINLKLRPEELNIETYYRIAMKYEELSS